MVLGGGSKNKKPLYTVVVTPRENINGGQMHTQQTPIIQPQQMHKSNVVVKDMTLDQLIKSYSKDSDDDDEILLPGFRYLKKMKNEIKKERVKKVFKKY